MVDDGNHREPHLGAEEAPPSREVTIPKRSRRTGEDDSHATRPWMLPVWLMIAGTCIAGAGWAISDHLIEKEPDSGAVPVVEADSAPIKVRPEDPGGLVVKDRDKLGLQNIGEEDPEKEVERLLPPPEEPMQKPVPKPAAEIASVAEEVIEELDISPSANGSADEQPPQMLEQEDETPPPVRSVDIKDEPAKPSFDTASVEDAAPSEAEVLMAKSIDEPSLEEPAAAEAKAPAAPKPVEKPTQSAALEQPEAAEVYLLQLAAARSQEGALGEWAKLVAREKALTEGLEPNVLRADLGDKGIWYSLRAGPFESREAALAHCDKMKSKDLGCFVVKG
jgi:hypothetical protein